MDGGVEGGVVCDGGSVVEGKGCEDGDVILT